VGKDIVPEVQAQSLHGRALAHQGLIYEVEGTPYLVEHGKKARGLGNAEPPFAKHGEGIACKQHAAGALTSFDLILDEPVEFLGDAMKDIEEKGCPNDIPIFARVKAQVRPFPETIHPLLDLPY
jgi:hypothetical protein